MKIFTFFIVLSFLVACGQEGKKTKAKISVGALTNHSNYPGGVLFVARNIETEQRISQGIITNQTVELEIPNGKWTFFVVGWSGGTNDKIFEGEASCDFRLNSNLAGGSIDLNFSLGHQKCADFYAVQGVNTIGSSPIYNTTRKEFIRVAVASCSGINDAVQEMAGGDLTTLLESPAVGPSIGCDGNEGPDPGDAQAYRLNIMDVDSEGKRKTSLLQSDCRELTQKYRNYTGINLPLTVGDTELRTQFKTYASLADCQANNSPLREYFLTGLIQGKSYALEDNGIGFVKFDFSDETSGQAYHTPNDPVFFVGLDGNEGPKCTQADKDRQPFAAGDSAENGGRGQYFICSAAQWENIAKGAGSCPVEDPDVASSMDCQADAEYILLDNIDFGGSNTTIPNVFSGKLQGEGNTLSNFNQPLFSAIRSTVDEVWIRDVKITQANISDNSTTDHIGILAKVLGGNGSGFEMSISGVEITNSSITIGTQNNASGVGGLIGIVDQTAAVVGDNIFIRENWVNVNLTSGSVGIGHSLGGLIGRAIGKSSDVNTAIAANAVGLSVNPYSYDEDSNFNFDSDQMPISVTVDGNFTFGGLIGTADDIEVRLGNIVVSDVTTNSNGGMGGLVGETIFGSSKTLKINDSMGYLTINPSANIQNIGGVIGRVNSDTSNSTPVFIDGSHGQVQIGELATPHSSYTVNNLGGIIGYYNYDGITLALRINNSRGVMYTHVDGSHHGGIAGYIHCSSSCSGFMAIQNSSALGSVSDSIAGLGNFVAGGATRRGGLVGKGDYVYTTNNIVQMAIEGTSEIGGFFGEGEDSIIFNSFGEVDLYARTGVVGGYAGKFTGPANLNVFDSKVNFDMTLGVDITNCTSQGCGYLFGDTNLPGYPHSQNVIANIGAINDIDSSFTLSNCGTGFAFCDAGEIEDVVTADDSSACDTLIGGTTASTEFSFVNLDGTSRCELKFYQAVYNFAPVFESGNIEYYKMGSAMDPYILDTPAKWDSIGDTSFLMSKTFKIADSGLDFANGTINPIGSSVNPFIGTIFGDGVIRNIVDTDQGNNGGNGFGVVAFAASGAQVGTREKPLNFENIEIKNTSTAGPSSVGIIGRIDTSLGIAGKEIIASVRVKNGDFSVEDSGSTDNVTVGGIIGSVIGPGATHVDIVDSSFEGKLTAINGTSGLMGGILGYHTGTSSVRISRSFANLVQVDDQIGGATIGGLVGVMGSSPLEIYHSYVWIDGNQENTPTPDDLDSTGAATYGGLVGYTTDGSAMSFYNNYVNNLVGTMAGVSNQGNLIGSSANAPSGSDNGVVGDVGAGGGVPLNADTIAADFASLNANWYYDDDWVLDENDRPRQRWEFPEEDNY